MEWLMIRFVQDLVPRNGQMVLSIRDIFKIIFQKVSECFDILMVIFIKEDGKREKLKVKTKLLGKGTYQYATGGKFKGTF